MPRKRTAVEISLTALLIMTVPGPSGLLYAKGGGHSGGGHGGGHESHGGHHSEGHHGEHHEGHHGEHHERYHHEGNYYHHGTKYYRLPEGHTYFRHGGVDYHYWDGAYYTKRDKEYVVVPPPIGAVIPTIPQGCVPSTIEGKACYICNDVTYLATPQGYQIVEEPESKATKTDQ